MKNKRYAVAFNYEGHEEYNTRTGGRLAKYIHDHLNDFNVRLKIEDDDKSTHRTWTFIDTQELNQAKEYFKDGPEVLELIDLANREKNWGSACRCCGSISLNTIPYTYRGTEAVGRSYECPICSGLSDEHADELMKIHFDQGIEAALDTLKEWEQED